MFGLAVRNFFVTGRFTIQSSCDIYVLIQHVFYAEP